MKPQIDIGIVMVNYNNYEDTIQCVESFLNLLDTKSFHIVVFDNCSPNKSGTVLLDKYKDNEKVDVVLSDSNLGNGAGWNAGLKHLRERFEPKFSILSDNDVLLLDNHLFGHLNEEYKESGFAVCGPMIFAPNGRCDCNPIFDIFYSRQNALYDLKYHKKYLRATKLHLDKLYRFYRAHNPFIKRHKNKIYQIRKDTSPGIYLQRRENVVLHGCFFIFSPIYFNYFDGLDVRSFMYAEEDILYAHLVHNKLKTVYLPSVKIYHKGDSSVKSTYDNIRKRRIFLTNQYIKAIEAYLGLLDELELS